MNDALYLQMGKAWRRGISTNEFRKCLKSDIMFIIDLNNAENKFIEKKNRENEIKQAQEDLMNRKWK